MPLSFNVGDPRKHFNKFSERHEKKHFKLLLSDCLLCVHSSLVCFQGVTHCLRETAKLGPLAFYKVTLEATQQRAIFL